MNIRNLDPEQIAPLYCQYGGQTTPQPAYLYIHLPDRTVWADYASEIGYGMTTDVYHGHTLRYRLASPYVSADAVNDLYDEIGPLASSLADMYSSRWDGNNHVGGYSDPQEAARISEEIELLCAECGSGSIDCDQVYDAEDWMEGGDPADDGLTADMSDADVEALAKLITDTAAEDRIRVLDMYEYLIERRDAMSIVA
jgi:hypothetical protein